MGELANFSAKKVISILEKYFGFFVVSQKGSHIKLRRETPDRTITTIVPNHSELAGGTLRNILRLAQVDVEAFLEVAKK